MSWSQRAKCQLKNFLKQVICCKQPKTPETQKQNSDVEDGGAAKATQYRLEATRRGTRKGICASLVSCIFGSSSTSATVGIGISPNQRLALYLHWMFRVNFIFLFAVMCAIFFVLVMIFAGLTIGAGRIDNECVRVGGQALGNGTSDFADAFSLSWATFSTVGYGSTYPALVRAFTLLGDFLFLVW
jgi:hypothetical protein